jgi:hypothetical protein
LGFGWLLRQDERFWRMEKKDPLPLKKKRRSQTVGTVQAAHRRQEKDGFPALVR